MDADHKHLEEQLKKYPTSLLSDVNWLEKRYLELKIRDFEAELDQLNTQIEKCRAYNLISFLKYRNGDNEDAIDYNCKSLEVYPGNIIGLSNRCWFLLKSKEKYREIYELLKQLQDAITDRFKETVAKAEVAYTYSRLGIHFYEKACRLYLEAIKEAKSITKSDITDSVDETICIWSFNCALAQTRLFSTCNVCNETDLEVSKSRYISVCELCRDVIDAPISTEISIRLKPKAYVLLGIVADDIEMKREMLSFHFVDLLPKSPKLHVSAAKLFKKALDDCTEDDVFVLERCGRYYRSINKLDKAITLLRKAVAVKHSSFGYHHLALALKMRLEQKSGNSCSRTKQPRGNMVRSPKEVPMIDMLEESNRIAVAEILQCLDDANKTALNNEATYDKALLFRQIGETEKALTLFKSLIKNNRVSLVLLADSYDQSGYCMHELLASSKSTIEHVDEDDMNMYFKRSLEISCNIVAKIPLLQSCWETAPTLKSLLLGKAKTIRNLTDLSFLYRKMGEHTAAVDVLRELYEMVDKLSLSDPPKEEIRLKIIESHLKANSYDDAILGLDLLMLLPSWNQFMDKNIYISANIEGAFVAFENDKEVASVRFRNAFDYCRKEYVQTNNLGKDGECKSAETEFDILILCDQENEVNGWKILEVLKSQGVSAALNTNERSDFGKLESDVFVSAVNDAQHYLIVIDSVSVTNCFKHNIEMLKHVVSQRGYGNIVTLAGTKSTNLPPLLCRKIIEFDFDTNIESLGENTEFMKQLLEQIAMG